MKKTLSLVIALVLCISLCACGSLESKVEKKVKEYVVSEVESTYICNGVEAEIDSLTSIEEEKFLVKGTVSGHYLNGIGFIGSFTAEAKNFHLADGDKIVVLDCDITGIN